MEFYNTQDKGALFTYFLSSFTQRPSIEEDSNHGAICTVQKPVDTGGSWGCAQTMCLLAVPNKL